MLEVAVLNEDAVTLKFEDYLVVLRLNALLKDIILRSCDFIRKDHNKSKLITEDYFVQHMNITIK
jgi:hypothetical protein